MIILDKRKYERIVSELIDAKDIRELVERYSLDRIYFYHILKDISLGERSPNHKLLKNIAQRRKLSEDFVIEQAKSVLNFLLPYYQSFQTDSLDYYKILNVSRSATDEEIRRNWIELMKAHHPDKAGAEGLDTSKKINEAYEVLSSASKREAYDNKHLPPTPVIVPQHEMKKYYYAGALMVFVFLVVMYASGSGLIFQSPEEKERLVREFEAPDMPNTVYKGDYLDAEKVDKKISEIKPIEQAKRTGEKSAVKEKDATSAAVTQEMPSPAENTVVADAGPADETAPVEKTDSEDVTETVPAEEFGNAALEPKAEKTIEITEVTPDVSDKETQPTEPVPGEVKPAVKETLAAKSDEAPAPAGKEAGKSPEAPPAAETVKKSAEPSPKQEVLTAEKSGAVKDEQKPGSEIKPESEIKETEKAPDIKLAEKPAAPVKPKGELTEISVPEKENPPSAGEYYTVRQGDSLWTIAHKFGKTTGELVSLNGLSDSKLRIGEKILISGEGVIPPKPVTEVAVKKAEPVPVPVTRPKREITPAPVVAKAQAPVKPPVKTDITSDFNPKLATSAVAVRDTSVRPPEPIPPAAPPDRDSVYGFVTDYVSAYKNKDIDRVKALFMPDAVENGVSISRVLSSYSSNFSNLDIMKYDVKVSRISVENSLGYVRGEFFITFKDQRTGALKSSKGQINWTLSWTGGSWRIRELTYKIENTDTVG
ncbi:MAG TPA: DnaJ domain-containing protein [Thermodesulfobacteriota bacterium]|nr:DnaJ domain-containing protein [Thermodesulfobacteriota bacterium]